MNVQSHIQSGFKVCCNRFRIAVPACRRHTFAHAFKNVGADLVGIQRLQKGQDGLQVFQILLLYFLPLLDGGYLISMASRVSISSCSRIFSFSVRKPF